MGPGRHPRRARLSRLCLWAGGLAAFAWGCGSARELPPSPEPAVSPAAQRPPIGHVARVGNEPEGLVVDSRTGLVAVGLRGAPALALVDGRTGKVVRRVPLPGAPRHLQLAGPGGPVLVPAEAANALVRVALPGGAATRAPVGNFPHDATALGDRVFVGDERGDTLTVLEGTRPVARRGLPDGPGGLAATPFGVAVVAVRERVLALYDRRTLRRLARTQAGVGPTHVVSDGGNLVYVVDTQGDALLVYRLKPRLELEARVHLAGYPYGVVIDRRRRRLWVTLTQRNLVVELALVRGERPRPLAAHPTVRQPNTIGVDAATGRVFIAGRHDGTLQIFDGGDPRRVAVPDR